VEVRWYREKKNTAERVKEPTKETAIRQLLSFISIKLSVNRTVSTAGSP